MAFTKKNEEAVSPVIGVILMVAITVILAAVIAAFVFGMAGNISKTKVVAVTAQKTSATTIVVTNSGGQDQSALVALNVSTPSNAPTACASSGTSGDYHLSNPSRCGNSNPFVGSTITLTGSYSTRQQVVVTGDFNDGTVQVLLDTNI